jgi:hypothetical protein
MSTYIEIRQPLTNTPHNKVLIKVPLRLLRVLKGTKRRWKPRPQAEELRLKRRDGGNDKKRNVNNRKKRKWYGEMSHSVRGVRSSRIECHLGLDPRSRVPRLPGSQGSPRIPSPKSERSKLSSRNPTAATKQQKQQHQQPQLQPSHLLSGPHLRSPPLFFFSDFSHLNLRFRSL